MIDTAANVLTTTIPVGAGTVQAAFTPDGTRAYVTCQTAGVVGVIDTATNSVTTTITGLSLPTGAAVSPDGTRVYVPNAGDGTVAVIDTGTNTVSASILTGDVPILVALTPDGTRAYVSVAGENAVSSRQPPRSNRPAAASSPFRADSTSARSWSVPRTARVVRSPSSSVQRSAYPGPVRREQGQGTRSEHGTSGLTVPPLRRHSDGTHTSGAKHALFKTSQMPRVSRPHAGHRLPGGHGSARCVRRRR
ncbi:YncE family protein [Streptomyces violaceusniger]|uniref:YncE family protein n=1 Tax=Streptomyces violaceusniger TaxID=68280 RepID=A0A4D4LLE7_STRVO|nr:hypothetical protein SVIO_106930 [Streptomyces violaceusniger]